MTHTVWKYPIGVAPMIEIAMPQGAQVLSVQVQDNIPTVWALIDLNAKDNTTMRRFVMVPTGKPLELEVNDTLIHLDSLKVNDSAGERLVHVFEAMT